MAEETDFDVIIAGGGLAGIVSALILARSKKKVLLVEKKSYPFHKVCGEYVSNEVLPFLRSLGLDPFAYGASKITKLRLSTPSGKNIFTTLEGGGFGLSRYTMDKALFQLAEKNCVETLSGTRVTDIQLKGNHFIIETNASKTFTSKLVIGCYGKRESLDKKLNRDFINARTGYLGVKYHIKTDYPGDEVGLDNFEGGYCGIVKIEDDKFNLCYLYKRDKYNNFKTIPELEEHILFKNPRIKSIFSQSEFLFSEPEVINEISFASKKLIEDHVLMCGDSAGLITPLCGNGMAMAIRGAKLLSELILASDVLSGEITADKRRQLETMYEEIWNANFKKRLAWGRTIQQVFGNAFLTGSALRFIHAAPKLERWIIRQTHGNTISV